MNKIRKKINNFPKSPGVYFFCDSRGKILYIGKATNLRSRVQSYFRGADGRGERIASMVSQARNVEFQQTDSVLEALILESNLIKKHQPKYNIMEKDDKSFSYFVVTKEEFPRIIIVRKTDLDFKNLKTKIYKLKAVYGPYVSKYQMEMALKIVRRIFPFHSSKQKTEKGCLDFQIGMCPGPYAGAISKADYKKNIRGIEMILQGKKKSLISKMEKEMEKFSKEQAFEKAAVLRNKIFALKHIRDVALITKDFELESEKLVPKKLSLVRIEAYDISNISGTDAVGSMVVFNGNESDKSQYRKFKIKTVEGSNDVAMMREVLSRRFNNDWPMPDLILLDGGVGHLNMAKDLFGTLGLDVPIISVAKGKDRKKLDMKIAFIHNTKYIIHDTSNVKSQNKELEINEILQNKLLIKAIMDEAHRFAITYHRKLRRKSALAD